VYHLFIIHSINRPLIFSRYMFFSSQCQTFFNFLFLSVFPSLLSFSSFPLFIIPVYAFLSSLFFFFSLLHSLTLSQLHCSLDSAYLCIFGCCLSLFLPPIRNIETEIKYFPFLHRVFRSEIVLFSSFLFYCLT
jgi:hypothetical protein